MLVNNVFINTHLYRFILLLNFSYFPLFINGAQYQITYEQSNDLTNWSEVYSEIIERDSDIKFIRASIEKVETFTYLTSGTLTHTQSWSQEINYDRTAHVEVPADANGPFPVIIFLHGAGGTGMNMLNQYKDYFNNYIKIGMDGYLNRWNIKTENSKADDIEFLSSLISQLTTFNNVKADDITLLGTSNGAALVLKAIVELPTEKFKNAIYLAGQLSYDQYRDSQFWYNPYPSSEYTSPTILPDRSKIISFHGTNDTIIPYYGGVVNWLNKNFYPAQLSKFYIAKGKGFTGTQLTADGSDTEYVNIKKYSYLENDVIHYKINGGDHGLGGYKDSIVNLILEEIED